jgi:hypothetical protein
MTSGRFSHQVDGPGRFAFPAWTNRAIPIGLAVLAALFTFTVAAWAYYANDAFLAVGYAPAQPVEMSHKLHASDLGIDCRYCHSSAETDALAAIPPTHLCFNCHTQIKPDSPKLLLLRESVARGKAVQWTRVHKLPDHTYFDHGAHSAARIGCSTCHGRVDQMQVVEQTVSLSMGFCLECHRRPLPYVRSAADVVRMDWTPAEAAEPPRALDPPIHCSGCHR